MIIQEIYYPYARSDIKTLTYYGNEQYLKKLSVKRKNFNLKTILDREKILIKNVLDWQKGLIFKAENILGRGEWIMLWKSIEWDKKDKLKGSMRLAVDYLQWAIMLERVIKDSNKRRVTIFDRMDRRMYIKGENKYESLYYLSNYFGTDYQARVSVFVEGKTEVIIFPKIFEWLYGLKYTDLGIQFVDMHGVGNFFGGKIKVVENEYQDKKIISNLKNLIEYNINNWQIIPFICTDNEGGIIKLIEKAEFDLLGEKIKFNKRSELVFIWNFTNNNQSYEGNSFEFANYSNEEIARVLICFLGNKLCNDDKTSMIKEVEKIRKEKKAIQNIYNNNKYKNLIISKKVKINEVLFETFIKPDDELRIERPVFEVCNRIHKLARLNHQPVSKEIRESNQTILRDMIVNEYKD